MMPRARARRRSAITSKSCGDTLPMARPAAPIVRLMRTRFSGALGRAITTATVAAISDSRTKKCETWKPGSSVEISELIVELLLQRRVFGGRERCGRGHGGRLGLARPAPRHQTDRAGAEDPHEIRKRP